MSKRITNKCYANFHYLSNSRRRYWCLISIQIYTFNFDCILCIVFQTVSKFIRKTQRLTHQNMYRNILCSSDEIIAVNGINGWMNFDQCQNWIISIWTNIINHHHHRGRIQSNDRQSLKGDSFPVRLAQHQYQHQQMCLIWISFNVFATNSNLNSCNPCAWPVLLNCMIRCVYVVYLVLLYKCA